MSVDLACIIEVLKEALLRNLGDEVDLIFRYGSHLKGTAHKYSDLDISYMPVHESTQHSITVLLDDLLIDLYPIHWSQLESMAVFRNMRSPGISRGFTGSAWHLIDTCKNSWPNTRSNSTRFPHWKSCRSIWVLECSLVS